VNVIHLHVQEIRRSAGRSATGAAAYRTAVGSAAYRAGEKLHNSFDGVTHDYSKKRGVVYSRIFLPDNAPRSFYNRETLWNSVEEIEKHPGARTARELDVALPIELDRYEQTTLIVNYVQENFVDKGMCADVAIHDKEDGNPHAHIMLTMRSIDENGNWMGKQKKNYILNKNGNKIYDPKTKQYKCGRSIPVNDWSDRGKAEIWRQSWAESINREFKRKGLEKTVRHESFERQGLNREATKHLGHEYAALERRGILTEIGNENRAINARNRVREELERQFQQEQEKLRQLYQQKDELEREQANRIEQVEYSENGVFREPTGENDKGTANPKKQRGVKSMSRTIRIVRTLKDLSDPIRIVSTAVSGLTGIVLLKESMSQFNKNNNKNYVYTPTDPEYYRPEAVELRKRMENEERITDEFLNRERDKVKVKTNWVSQDDKRAKHARSEFEKMEKLVKTQHDERQRLYKEQLQNIYSRPYRPDEEPLVKIYEVRNNDPGGEINEADQSRAAELVPTAAKPQLPKPENPAHSTKRQAFEQKRAEKQAIFKDRSEDKGFEKNEDIILHKNDKPPTHIITSVEEPTAGTPSQPTHSTKRQAFDAKRAANKAKIKEQVQSKQELSKSQGIDMDR